jgi:hypothetical protein
MPRRLTVLLSEFLAGLSGNLVAGWIQKDKWLDLFLLSGIDGALIGVI